MIRQIAFGIAFSALVLASGLSTKAIPGHTTTKINHKQATSIPSGKVKASTNSQTNALEKSIFEQINRYRASKGMSKLTINPNITKQARIHSQNMARGKVPFSHNGFEGRVKNLPIKFNSAAENVAYNLGYSDPASEAVQGWIKSPGHLTNIKGKYNLTGIGVATNKEGEVYLTQIFLNNR
jgi:uncharacterized protein YkwD